MSKEDLQECVNYLDAKTKCSGRTCTECEIHYYGNDIGDCPTADEHEARVCSLLLPIFETALDKVNNIGGITTEELIEMLLQ